MLGAGFATRSGMAAGMRRMGVSPSMGFCPGTSTEYGGFDCSRGWIVAIASVCRDYAGSPERSCSGFNGRLCEEHSEK